jgi:hypothetical protein
LAGAICDYLKLRSVEAGGVDGFQISFEHAQRKRAWLADQQQGIRAVYDSRPLRSVHKSQVDHYEIENVAREFENPQQAFKGHGLALLRT